MIVLDIETTGFSHRKDKIIEVAAIKISRGKILDSFSSVVNPKIPLPSKITQLTGITEREVSSAPTFKEISSDLYNFMRGRRIIGYNVAFDKRFLAASDRKFSCLLYEDYLKFVKGLDYEFPNFKLETVARAFGITKKLSHRAMEDAEVLVNLIRILGC